MLRPIYEIKLSRNSTILFNLLALLPNFYFWDAHCALGYPQFSNSPEISSFPKILPHVVRQIENSTSGDNVAQFNLW